MRVVRLWKHLHLLKRGGIGLVCDGVNSAERGSCAVECPACPPPQNSVVQVREDGEETNNETIESDEHSAE